MGRRKNIIDDGSDSESEEEQTIQDEFGDDVIDLPNNFKRRKQDKDSQIYGVFNNDEFTYTKSQTSKNNKKKSDISFVSSIDSSLIQKSTSENNKNTPENIVKSGANLDRDFGRFNQHSKGIGLKLMQKMGYTIGEGLGASKSGITQPIEAKLRPTKVGISYGVKETTNNENKEVDMVKDTYKTKEPKSKIKYQTIEELSLRIDQNKPQIIIDMRGKDAQNHSEMPPSTKHEYSEDVALLLRLSREEIEQLEKEKLMINNKVTKLKDDIINAKDSLDSINLKKEYYVSKFKSLASELLKESASLSEHNVLDLADINLNLYKFKPLFMKLKVYCIDCSNTLVSREIETRIQQFGIIMIYNIVKKLVSSWDILNDPFFFISFFEDPELQLFFSPSEDDKLTSYDLLFYHVLYPKIRTTLINQWDQQDSIIKFIELWVFKMNPNIKNLLWNQIIIPKLKNEVENWDPRKTTEAIHITLHIWLHLIEDKFGPVLDLLFNKMSSVLSEWHPSDESAYNLLEPWKLVVKRKRLDSFVMKWVYPKLLAVLKFELKIDPSNQDMEPYTWIIVWEKLISPKIMVRLFFAGFFPHWFEILEYWLESDPNFSEVMAWFSYWKSQMPKTILDLDDVKIKLKEALDMINSKLDS